MVVQENVHDETAIIRRCVKGDVDAYGGLVDRYGARIFNLSLMMLGDRHEAEDVAQEAFIRAFRGLAGFRGKARFSSWLHQIALNLCRDHLKRRARAGGPVPMSEEVLEGSADGRGRMRDATVSRFDRRSWTASSFACAWFCLSCQPERRACSSSCACERAARSAAALAWSSAAIPSRYSFSR